MLQRFPNSVWKFLLENVAQKYTSMLFDKTHRNQMRTSDLGQGVAPRGW